MRLKSRTLGYDYQKKRQHFQSTAEKEVLHMTDFEILMIVFTVIGLLIAMKNNRT